MELVAKWTPIPDLVDGFDAISFTYRSGDERSANLVMHGRRTLVLNFSGVIALRYEDECPGFDPLPHPLPILKVGVTFPLLQIEKSRWLEQWTMHKGLAHFALISSDDLVQLVAKPTVEAHWDIGDAA